ncbi:MAG: hypothetical protein M1812_001480 [Candelaria pacifica]|nr:MAG: hypothetical protein M1812_001480 [Candelaria pacifica]
MASRAERRNQRNQTNQTKQTNRASSLDYKCYYWNEAYNAKLEHQRQPPYPRAESVELNEHSTEDAGAHFPPDATRDERAIIIRNLPWAIRRKFEPIMEKVNLEGEEWQDGTADTDMSSEGQEDEEGYGFYPDSGDVSSSSGSGSEYGSESEGSDYSTRDEDRSLKKQGDRRANSSIQYLVREVLRLESEAEQMDYSIHDPSNTVADREQRLERLSAMVTDRDERLRRWSEVVDDRDDEIEHLNKVIDDREERIRDRDGQAEDREEVIERLNLEVEEKEVQIRDLRNDVEDLRNENEEDLRRHQETHTCRLTRAALATRRREAAIRKAALASPGPVADPVTRPTARGARSRKVAGAQALPPRVLAKRNCRSLYQRR